MAEEGKLSAFEMFCLTWYCENVTQFGMEAGLVAEIFRELKLKGSAKGLFLTAMNKLYKTFRDLAESEAKSEAAATHG